MCGGKYLARERGAFGAAPSQTSKARLERQAVEREVVREERTDSHGPIRQVVRIDGQLYYVWAIRNAENQP